MLELSVETDPETQSPIILTGGYGEQSPGAWADHSAATLSLEFYTFTVWRHHSPSQGSRIFLNSYTGSEVRLAISQHTVMMGGARRRMN